MAQINNIKSTLEIFDIQHMSRQIIYEEESVFEAPNWSRDGMYLLINSAGLLYKIDLISNEKTQFHTNEADKLNNDHGISPDGSMVVLSHSDEPGVSFGEHDWKSSRIYTMSTNSGQLKPITEKGSFWHGWSPDGTTLLYTGLRNENFDIYSIGVNGGKERRLTDYEGLDDGPEFSADGTLIYYNSMASGSMELWQMKTDGTAKEQLTNDLFSNWFPHPSPDGKWLVFISYLEDQGSQHPPMKNVALRLLNLEDNSIRELCRFTGGQGSLNVPSWSLDGNRFAFVSYAYIND